MTKTTDNQNEVFAVVDENDRVVGEATRREVHKDKNLIHRSVGVAVFDAKGELFMQQRSPTKDTEPLKWTISCSGHVDKGEGYEETAVRELSEELGLDIIFPISLATQRNRRKEKVASEDFLISLSSGSQGVPRLNDKPFPHFYHSRSEIKENLQRQYQLKIEPVCKFLCRAPYESEMVMLFRTVYEGPFRLLAEEIIQGKFFTQKELTGILQRGEMELSFIGGKSLEKLGWFFPLYKKDKEE